jgi:hypothetical protein
VDRPCSARSCYHCACCSGSADRPSARSCRPYRCRTCRACRRASSTARSTTRSAERCARPTRNACARCGACEFASCCGSIVPGWKRIRAVRQSCGAKWSLFRRPPLRSKVRARKASALAGHERWKGSMPPSSCYRRLQACRRAARCRGCGNWIPVVFTISITSISTAALSPKARLNRLPPARPLPVRPCEGRESG